MEQGTSGDIKPWTSSVSDIGEHLKSVEVWMLESGELADNASPGPGGEGGGDQGQVMRRGTHQFRNVYVVKVEAMSRGPTWRTRALLRWPGS